MLAQGFAHLGVQHFPGPGVAPLPEIGPDGRPRGILTRQGTPLAAGALLVKEGIENLTHIGTAGPSPWFCRGNQRRDHRPFLIRQVAGIERLSHGDTTSEGERPSFPLSLSRFTYSPFIDGSARALTQRAIAPVLLDFQARASDPTVDITTFADQLGAQPRVATVQPFISAGIGVLPAAGATAAAALPTRLFAVPPAYPASFTLLRVSAGSFAGGGALVSEQLAVRLHVQPGDTITLVIPGLAQPYPVTLTGIANTDLADPLFTGPGTTPEGANTNTSEAVIIDYATYTRDLRAALTIAAAGMSPTATPTNLQGLPFLDRQLHVQIVRSTLPADPGAAQLAVSSLRRSLERQASGQIRITDNVVNTLTTATKDVVAARLLFVFLGLPGVLLAAYLSRYATQLVSEGQRREIALLRTRGLAPRQILVMMGWLTALVAMLGTLVGVAIGALSTILLFGVTTLTQSSSLGLTLGASLALGLVLGGVGIFLPARRMVEGEITEERRVVTATTQPLWLRLPLDVGLLAAGAVALWVNSTNTTVGATEAAAVSLGISSFLGPLLCWLGAGLLFLRVCDWLLRRPISGWRGGVSGLARRSLRQRHQQSAGIAVLLALALSFGVTTTTFSATYDASRRAEARYYVGSDLRVTPSIVSPQLPTFGDQLRVPGVAAVTPVFVNNSVLVGAQTQTVYGVDMATLPAATTIPDTFFVNDTAGAVLARLRQTPDGLLVSNELATAYNILNGDMVRMRVPSQTGKLTDVSVRVVGIFRQFPTSSQNSDLIVNRDLLTGATGNPHAAFFLLKTDGSAATNDRINVALGQQLRAGGIAARIETATHAISQDQSSLAGLNLAGLAAIDRIYAALIIAIGLGVFFLGLLLERQREFGTLQALGAARAQVARLVLREGGILVGAGLIGGIVIGGGIAWLYLGFLPSIFSVTLPILTVSWAQLGLLIGLGGVGLLAAATLALVRLWRQWPAEVLRDL